MIFCCLFLHKCFLIYTALCDTVLLWNYAIVLHVFQINSCVYLLCCDENSLFKFSHVCLSVCQFILWLCERAWVWCETELCWQFSLVCWFPFLVVLAWSACIQLVHTLLALGERRCLELDVPLSHAGYVTKALLVQCQRQLTTSPPKAEFVYCKLALCQQSMNTIWRCI